MIESDLRALRKERKLTREDLGLAAGVSMAWLQRLEAGSVPLSAEVAARLALCLGVSAEDLLENHAAACARRRDEARRRVAAAA